MNQKLTGARTPIAFVTIATLAVVAGCDGFGKKKTETATTKPVVAIIDWSGDHAVAASLQPVNRPVAGPGALPQVFLVETPSTIRVTNYSTGEEIATFEAKGGEVVHVSQRGVRVGTKSVIGAQLATGTYAIYRVEPDAGVLHVRQDRTISVMPPTSQPATRPADAPPTSQ